MAAVPLGDLIYDLLCACVRDDDEETMEAADALAKGTIKAIKGGELKTSSPTVQMKIQRTRRRLKAWIMEKGAPPLDDEEGEEGDADDGDDNGGDGDDGGRDPDALPSVEDLD